MTAHPRRWRPTLEPCTGRTGTWGAWPRGWEVLWSLYSKQHVQLPSVFYKLLKGNECQEPLFIAHDREKINLELSALCKQWWT